MDKFIIIILFVIGIFYYIVPIIKKKNIGQIVFSSLIYIIAFFIIMLKINNVDVPDPSVYIKKVVQYILNNIF